MLFALELLSVIALMLWGLRMVRNGIMSAYGPAIKRVARDSSDKRIAPFVSGFFAALALQSSTATAMIAANFAAKRTLGVLTAFIIMLGADLGTAVAAVIASQKITAISPALLVVGIFGFLNSDSNKARGVFRALGGIGLVLLALSMIGLKAQGITSNAEITAILKSVLSFPALAIMAGITLTYLAHSSLAIILLTISGLSAGLFDNTQAIALVMGANIGSGLLPFVANLKSRHPARVAVTANLFLRTSAALGLIWAWPHVQLDSVPSKLVEPLMVHLGLNVAVGVVGLVFAALIIRGVSFFVRPDTEDKNEVRPKFIINTDYVEASKALALAKREALVMAEIAQDMLERSKEILSGDPDEEDEELGKLDDDLDRLFEAIKLYVARVLTQRLSEEETRRAMDLLSFTANMEHIGDIIDGNLMSIAHRKRRLHAQFSDEGREEITSLFEAVIENFNLAVNTFLTDGRDLARQLHKAKSEVREMEQQFIASHMDRLGSGVAEAVKTSSLHIDVIRDLKRINSHLTAIAYPVLLASGEVPKTKWKKTAL